MRKKLCVFLLLTVGCLLGRPNYVEAEENVQQENVIIKDYQDIYHCHHHKGQGRKIPCRNRYYHRYICDGVCDYDAYALAEDYVKDLIVAYLHAPVDISENKKEHRVYPRKEIVSLKAVGPPYVGIEEFLPDYKKYSRF